MQGTEDPKVATEQPGPQAEQAAAPSAEASPAPQSGADLSPNAQIHESIAEGIRARIARGQAQASSGAQEPPTQEATVEPTAPPAPSGDPDEDADDESDAAPEAPATPPASEQAPPPDQPQRLSPRQKLRQEVASLNERVTSLQTEKDDAVRALTAERDQAIAQLGVYQQRYQQIKPQEQELALSNEEFARLQYIKEHGGLSWEDEQRLEKAEVVRGVRDVHISEADQRIAEAGQATVKLVSDGLGRLMGKPGITPDMVTGAADLGQVFERAYDVAFSAGKSASDAEHKERIAQLETDNTALSARVAGFEATGLEVGGRSAPLGAIDPGPDASPAELIAAGIRARQQRGNGRAMAPA